MKTIYSTEKNDLARVYIAEMKDGNRVEFVESVQPPLPIEEKWVIIVSTLKGCPVNCPICDAGGTYKGKLSKEEILFQIDHIISQRYSDKFIPAKKLKIQFARMGDPAFNNSVLEVLEELPYIYKHKGLLPCISTVAPCGNNTFFEKLINIKNKYYSDGNFQMQFSIHTTDEKRRKELIPANIWSFKEISEYGELFYRNGDRKITLNFATPCGYGLEPDVLLNYFTPDKYIIKLTPVNPTFRSVNNNLYGMIKTDSYENNMHIEKKLQNAGYETILSIGELEENIIGSNCGMYLNTYSKQQNL